MGCCVHARLYLSACCASVGLGCRCAMSVRTNRGSCSNWGSHIAKTGGLSVGDDVRDLVQCRSGLLTGVKGSRRGRRFSRGQGGKTGAEEGWASGGKGERRHWVRGKRRTLQGIRLDIVPQRKVWRGGQSKGKGTRRGPGGSWKGVQD